MNPEDAINDLITYEKLGSDYEDVLNYTMSTTTARNILANAITNSSIGNAITSAASVNIPKKSWDQSVLDQYELNYMTFDHKLSGHELLLLKEQAPDYAAEIKQTIARNVSDAIAKKVKYTKKHDLDSDVHHFIGRVWVFTDEELKELLEKTNV